MVNLKFFSIVKKTCLVLLMLLLLAGCNKYEPLHFPRTPYEGNELRTDGFWYHVGHSQYVPDWMSLYFLYRDGTLLMATTVDATDPCEVTVDSISLHGNDYNNQIHWGVFEVKGDTLKWSEWFWPNPAPGIAILTTFEIINDTCIKGKDDYYYYFHPFDYKPDSTIARQWIP